MPGRAEQHRPSTDTPSADSDLRHTSWNIPFAPGDYHHFEGAALDPVIAYLRTATPKPTLRVEGFSYSRGTLATQALADKRARRVRDALVAAGVERQSMDVQGVYANNVTSASPYSGVRVHVSLQPQTVSSDDIRSTKVPAPDSTVDQPQPTTATTAAAGQPPANGGRKPTPWPVSPGLLRDTVSRYSHHHGWGLVWQLEEGGKVLDWVIERPFTLNPDSLAEGLQSLLGPYADYLQADLCAADKTVLVSRPGAAGCTDA